MEDEVVFSISKEEIIENLRNSTPMKKLSDKYVSSVTGFTLEEVKKLRIVNYHRNYNQDPERIINRRIKQNKIYKEKKEKKDKEMKESGEEPAKYGFQKKDIFRGAFPVEYPQEFVFK